MDKKCSSPNNKNHARLILEGEIRFGPAYFKLELNGLRIPDKLFGDKLFWSHDSIYLATEEWLTTDYQKGPITRLLLFNFQTMKQSGFKRIEKGFVRDVTFFEDRLKYIKEYAATGRDIESEVEYSNIKNWINIGL
ncbi:MAG: hypothetical protein SVW57_01515 [Thermodesulfobacteriota bacterium]|nr:hypothetical protein [Thermodesulfobacteriota bacterium]